MFEQIIDRIKRLESPVASIAVLGTMVDDNSNVRLQNQDCLTQLESQFNERMANLKTLLEITASHTIVERNESSSTSSEPKPEVSPTDQLQTLITIISQDPENSPID
jgi:hypothetical protein